MQNWQNSTGMVTLKSNSPLSRLIAAIFFAACFWAPIIVGYFMIFKGDNRPIDGLGRTVLPFMLIPAGLMGLGSLGFVGYYMMAIFNPRLTVLLNGENFHIGGTLHFSWNFSGRSSVIQQFDIILQGIESTSRKTKSSSGNSGASVEKNIFFQQKVYSAPGGHEIAVGEIDYNLPQNVMHSFESSHNKISWELVICGDIAKRPDIRENYTLTMLPTANSD